MTAGRFVANAPEDEPREALHETVTTPTSIEAAGVEQPVRHVAAERIPYSFEKVDEKRLRSSRKADRDFEALKINLRVPDTRDDALLREFVIHHNLNIGWYEERVRLETRWQRAFFFGTLAVIVAIPTVTYLIAANTNAGSVAALTPVVTGFLAFQNAMRSYFEKRNYVTIFHRAASALKKSLYTFEQKWAGCVPPVHDVENRELFRNSVRDAIASARSVEDDEESAYFIARASLPSLDMSSILTGSTQAATSAITQQIAAIGSTIQAQQQALAIRAQASSQGQAPISADFGRSGSTISLTTDRGDLSLPVDRSRIALRLREPGRAQEVAMRLGLSSDGMTPHDGFVVFVLNAADATQYAERKAAAEADPAVIRASTVFGGGGSRYSFATDRVMLELNSPASVLPAAVRAIVDAQRATATQVEGAHYTVLVPPDIDPFAVATALNADAEVAFAEPDLVHVGIGAGTYAIQPPADQVGDASLAYTLLNVEPAWKTAGDRNPGMIRVAILDDNADTNHPDLASVTLAPTASFDAFAVVVSSISTASANPRHGIACAGLAVAQPATAGMKGVGAGAKLVVVRVSVTAPDGSLLTSNTHIRRGIEWAVQQGADVICMSWATEPSIAVRSAIESAATTARGGKGCIIVAAAGNDGGPVAFPARLDSVIAVAATDATRQIKRAPGWASAFGPEIDLAMPGMPTFTTAPNGAYGTLDGTSAATAMAAGAAALVLRLNPALGAKDVRNLLIATSQALSAGPVSPSTTIRFVDLDKATKRALAAAPGAPTI